MLDRPNIKFGDVARLAETTFDVTVKNPNVEEIRISSLTTSCGCISWTEKAPISIPSLTERRLTIHLDTIRHVGDKGVDASARFIVILRNLEIRQLIFPIRRRVR